MIVLDRGLLEADHRFQVDSPKKSTWENVEVNTSIVFEKGSLRWRFSRHTLATRSSARDRAWQTAKDLDTPTAKVVDCVQMMLIFSLGRSDVLPVDDLGFVEGVREAYALEDRPTPKEMRERGEVWRPYRTFATWYMWGVRRLTLGIEGKKTRNVSL